MLNDNEAPLRGEKNSFESATMTSYEWYFDMFRISLTVLKFVAKNRFHCYSDAL
jgi:hypothetical protein